MYQLKTSAGLKNNKISDNFTYSIEDNSCISGKCIDNQIEYFKSEYLEKTG